MKRGFRFFSEWGALVWFGGSAGKKLFALLTLSVSILAPTLYLRAKSQSWPDVVKREENLAVLGGGLLLVGYLACSAGIAWTRSRGPRIVLGNTIEPEHGGGDWRLRLKVINVGKGSIKPVVQVREITDAVGKPIDLNQTRLLPITLSWTHGHAEIPEEGEESVWFGHIGVINPNPAETGIKIRDIGGGFFTDLFFGVPATDRRVILAKVKANCEGGNTEVRWFSIRYDAMNMPPFVTHEVPPPKGTESGGFWDLKRCCDECCWFVVTRFKTYLHRHRRTGA
jgi:hypothetical protein